MAYCSNCGSPDQSGSFCSNCGAQPGATSANDWSDSWRSGDEEQVGQPYPPQGYSPFGSPPMPIESKKTLAGLMGILLGGLGIHKFVLGYTTEGILAIVITIFTCGFGALIGLIEGIIYLTKSDEEFIRTYQLNKRGWF